MNEQGIGPVNESRPITKGCIVHYKDGWYRVSARFNHTVNLCGIFSSYIHHKKVPLSEVYEDEAAWYQAWSQSESYKCM